MVVKLGKRHVDGKLPLVSLSEVTPLNGGHVNVCWDPPVDLDWAGTSLHPFAGTSCYHGVVGGVFDERGDNVTSR